MQLYISTDAAAVNEIFESLNTGDGGEDGHRVTYDELKEVQFPLRVCTLVLMSV